MICIAMIGWWAVTCSYKPGYVAGMYATKHAHILSLLANWLEKHTIPVWAAEVVQFAPPFSHANVTPVQDSNHKAFTHCILV